MPSRIPIVPTPKETVWRTQKRRQVRDDPGFLVRWSIGVASKQGGRQLWSVSILERGRGCEHRGHLAIECQTAPCIVSRVFSDPKLAKQAFDDAVAGRWGRLYGQPGAPWSAPRDKASVNLTAPQHRLWERHQRGQDVGRGTIRVDEPRQRVTGATVADEAPAWKLKGGRWTS